MNLEKKLAIFSHAASIAFFAADMLKSRKKIKKFFLMRYLRTIKLKIQSWIYKVPPKICLRSKYFLIILHHLFLHPRKFYNALSDQAKKWTLRGLVVLLIILIAVPVSFWLKSNKVSAAWWNDMWQYRKSIAVTNSSGGALTDFQVKVLSNIDLSADITAGKIQSDLDDLRFTDINGNLLPYWIEDTTTSSVDAWVKMPSIPTSGATVYMYYGNPNASSYADGNDVFEFFDDFSNGAGKWTNQEGAAFTTVSDNGNMVGSHTRVSGSTWPGSFAGDETWGNVAIETKISVASGNRGGIYFRHLSSTDTDNGYYLRLPEDSFGFTTNGGAEAPLGSYVLDNNTWYQMKITVYGTTANFFMNGANQNLSRTVQNSTGSIGVTALDNSGPVYLDDFRVRKYASADPSAASPASEEKGTGPVAYWSFDEGYGTTVQDKSSNNNDGTLNNMSATSSPTSGWQTEDKCVSEKCLAFDGTNDYVQIPDSASNSVAGDLTLSVWVRPTLLNSRHSILSKNYNNEFDLIAESNGGVAFYHGDNSWEGVSAFPAGTIAVNRWTHLEVVRTMSDKKMYFYANGKLVAGPTSFSKTPVESSSPIRIGYRNDNSYYFNGRIDEPKIYNYARTAAQIKMDYNAGLAGTAGQEGAAVSMGGKSQKWLNDGLMGHWKMDEASWNGTSGEVVDASGNGRNGTAVSGATTTVGKFAKGGSFDGSNDYVDTGTKFPSISNALTVSAWVYPGASQISYADIWGNHQGDYKGIVFQQNNTSTNSYYFSYGNGSGWATTSVSPVSLTASTWQHVVAVKDELYCRIYVNGIEQAKVSCPDNIVPGTTSNFMIGNGYTSIRPFNGKVDDLRVYDRALSDREIRDLYSYAPGPIGWWKMDEKNGQYAYDSSGNGNSGTLGSSTGIDSSDPTWINGKIGSGLSFDGSSDYVDLNQDLFDGACTGSISLWIKRTGSWNESYNTILTKSSGAGWVNNHIQISRNASTDALNLTISDNTNSTTSSVLSPNIELQTWYHLEMTWDGSTLIGYTNGIETDRYSTSICVASDSSRFSLGRGAVGTNRFFNGIIDDVKFYNYARTSEQVQEDMSARGGSFSGGNVTAAVSASGKNAVGYWKFDEGQGATAYDFSPQKNNGTISGATWSNSGKFGKALSFDGVNDCISNSSLQISKTNSWSFSTWQYKATGSSGDWQGFIGRNLGADGGYWMWHSGILTWYQDYYDPGGGYQYYGYFGSQINLGDEVPYDRWFNLTVTYNGSNYETKVYINGVLKETRTATWSPRPVSQFTFSQIGCASGRYFNGLIDEIKVYNFVLTADDIKAEYNNGTSLNMGSTGTTTTGAPSNSEDRKYCPPGDTTATCGPIAEWKLDEMTGTTANDTSGNGNMGTLTNGPTWEAKGKKGSAINFDGSNDYISVGTAVSDTMESAGTINLWIYPTAYGGILSRSVGGGWLDERLALHMYGSSPSGAPRLTFSNGSSYWNHQCSESLALNQWTYLTVSWDGSNVKFYYNGRFINQVAQGGIPEFTGVKTWIGAVEGLSPNYFAGKIDDVRIYSYARTPAQIAWDYNRGAPVGWWKMDEGEGTTVYDWSGNGNNGAMTSMDPATDWVTGRINKALDFDGSNDYVNLNNADIVSANEGSISAWVNAANWDANRMTVFSSEVGPNWNELRFVLFTNADGGLPNSLTFAVANGSSSTTDNCNTGAIFSANTWYHIVGTYDGTVIKIYVNGFLKDTYNSSIIPGDFTPTKTMIGWHYGDRYWNGQIDDVRVYNYALTAKQVEQVYNGGAVNFR